MGPTGSARVIEHVRLRATEAAHASGQLAVPDDAPMDDAPMDDAPLDDAPLDGAPMDDAPLDGAAPVDAPPDDSPSPGPATPLDPPHDVPAAFVAGALLGVATDWLRRGCPRTPMEMTVLTKPLLLALAAGTGGPPRS